MYNKYENETLEAGPIKEIEISQVVGKLAQNIEVAIKEFIELSDRITPVLRTDLAEGHEKPATPEYYTPLAQDINDKVRKLTVLIENIKSVRNRIEL